MRIAIVGSGVSVDAVVSDFISGAVEHISPDNEDDHWDIIEGQGSLFHPGYSGVSLGLLHGSQPDGFVVCHDAARTRVSGWEHYSLPSIEDCIAAGFDEAVAKKVEHLIYISEYKRFQSAPGARLTPRSFWLDRRYPIVNAWRTP